jgi:hypothetical protein
MLQIIVKLSLQIYIIVSFRRYPKVYFLFPTTAYLTVPIEVYFYVYFSLYLIALIKPADWHDPNNTLNLFGLQWIEYFHSTRM